MNFVTFDDEHLWKFHLSFFTTEMKKQSAVSMRHCHVPRIPWSHKRLFFSLISTCWGESIEKQRHSPWGNIVLGFSLEIHPYEVQVKHHFHVWDQWFGSFVQRVEELTDAIGNTMAQVLLHFDFLIPYWDYCRSFWPVVYILNSSIVTTFYL